MERFIRIFLCIAFAGLTLYSYIDKINGLTELRLAIPVLAREVRDAHEKNLELQYAIDTFESPLHLMEMARKPEFGHLKYPTLDEIIQLPEKNVACPTDQ